MSAIAKFENLKDLVVELRGQSVLLDSDVAQIYGVETRDINKAVTNNPDKFPDGYVVEISKPEKSELVENFHRFNKLKHSTVNPKAFPEKGLYMLATILKSPQAVQATLAIIETFAKIREISRTIQGDLCITSQIRRRRHIGKSRYPVLSVISWIPDQARNDETGVMQSSLIYDPPLDFSEARIFKSRVKNRTLTKSRKIRTSHQ